MLLKCINQEYRRELLFIYLKVMFQDIRRQAHVNFTGSMLLEEETRLKDNHVKGLPSTTAEGPRDKDAQLTV